MDQGHLSTFDNGNTRCAPNPTGCHSRGQAYLIDEAARTATLVVDDDLGNYSHAFGWAQTLRNGDHSFTSGDIQAGLGFNGQDEEFTSSGLKDFAIQRSGAVYRAYRLSSLYGY